MMKALLIGYGNPGRLDDGLGPALAEAVEKLKLPGLAVEANYQLVVEDAADFGEYDVVVFADADVGGPEPFWVQRIEPGGEMSFSTHSVQPKQLLALARKLFKAEPAAYVLGIRGYEFNEFGERLSPRARENLDAAVAYVVSSVRNGVFKEINPDGGDWASEPPDLNSEEGQCKTENT